jgi:glutamate--cysteine ligase
MERYLDGWGPAGRLMMCSTASVQVNVEAGVHPPARGRTSTVPVQDQAARWELLHAIGPTLVAAFANSARSAGSSTGWKSSRQATWLRLDPARTGVPAARAAESFAETYTRWALDAPLMLVRREFGTWDAPAGVTFRDWLRQGRRIVPDRPAPTLDDLSYHMTTLFPQVRPKGYFEVRYLDAQPEDWWRVPTAVIAALLGDQATADRVRDACAPVEGRWRDAARIGLDDAELARSARVVLPLAANALAAEPVSAHLADEVAAYYERWTVRGRCPADDPPEKFQRAPGNDQHSANGEGTS